MPFARLGAPWRNQEEFERAYPAQFICEAIDQTRGWFYSLMAVGTLVFGRSSYENVVCLGLVVDEHGRKMSKHLGNVLEPIPLMEAHGADAVRWFFAAVRLALVDPADRRRHAGRDRPQGAADLLEHGLVPGPVRQRGGRAGAGVGAGPGGRARRRPRTGRCWTGGCSASCTRWPRDVTAALEAFDTAAAGRRLAAFIDDLSNWYVRRSRRRFWDGPGTPDGAAAFATLYECLQTLTRLMAPITPFLTDYVWGVLRGRRRPGVGAPGPAGPPPTRRWSTPGCPGRWRWPGGWWSWAGRPGPPRRCRSASRWPAPLVGAAGFADLPARAARPGGQRAQRARAGAAGDGRRRPGRLRGEAELPGARAAGSARAPRPVAAAISAADPARAGRGTAFRREGLGRGGRCAAAARPGRA